MSYKALFPKTRLNWAFTSSDISNFNHTKVSPSGRIGTMPNRYLTNCRYTLFSAKDYVCCTESFEKMPPFWRLAEMHLNPPNRIVVFSKTLSQRPAFKGTTVVTMKQVLCEPKHQYTEVVKDEVNPSSDHPCKAEISHGFLAGVCVPINVTAVFLALCRCWVWHSLRTASCFVNTKFLLLLILSKDKTAYY